MSFMQIRGVSMLCNSGLIHMGRGQILESPKGMGNSRTRALGHFVSDFQLAGK
jgi:hypothetical protein